MPTYRLTPSEQVTIQSDTPEALVAEVAYGPAGNPPPGHLHPAQDEHFTVLEGEVHVRLRGEERVLGPGDVLQIPRTTPHQMWNAHPTDAARVRWETTPAGRTQEWWAALDAAGSGDGRPPLPTMAALLREYRDVFRLAAPQWLVQPAMALLSVGRKL